MKYDAIQDIRAFDQLVWEKVQGYIEDKEACSFDTVLGINASTYEVIVDSAKNLSKDYEQYQLSTLIRLDEQGDPDPDCDATNDIANKYFFVR